MSLDTRAILEKSKQHLIFYIAYFGILILLQNLFTEQNQVFKFAIVLLYLSFIACGFYELFFGLDAGKVKLIAFLKSRLKVVYISLTSMAALLAFVSLDKIFPA